MIEGDTELGLEVKNLMDAIELEHMPAPLRIGLMQLADFVEAGLNEDAKSPEIAQVFHVNSYRNRWTPPE